MKQEDNRVWATSSGPAGSCRRGAYGGGRGRVKVGDQRLRGHMGGR